jgi:hypothetical protein
MAIRNAPFSGAGSSLAVLNGMLREARHDHMQQRARGEPSRAKATGLCIFA